MLLDAYEAMPANVLAPERKKRAFISAVLARNAIDRDYAYNRRLFKRLSTGRYQLNPVLALAGVATKAMECIPAFSFLSLSLIKESADPRHAQHIETLLSLAGLPPATEAMVRHAESHRARHSSSAPTEMRVIISIIDLFTAIQLE